MDVLAERVNTTREVPHQTIPDAWPQAARSTRRARAGRRRHTDRRVMTADNTADHRHRLTLLLGPAGPELTCEQCFEELDRYVELELAAANADTQVPGIRAHLEGCSACHEDYESLLAFVAQQRTAD